MLLAGDAAHLFTPTGGFGLNTGIEDVANLSWKLAAVLQGWGGDGLLATYETERKPIAVRNTDVARDMGRAWHDIEVTPAIEQDYAAGDAERAQAAQSSFVVKNHFVLPEERDFVGVVLGARYDNSPHRRAGRPRRRPMSSRRYMPSSVPGGRAPHLWLDDTRGPGSSLFDRLGRYFTLLRFGDDADEPRALEDAARRAGMPLDGRRRRASAGLRELYQCKLALIRPDQHIAWRGDELPHDVDALIAQRDRVASTSSVAR